MKIERAKPEQAEALTAVAFAAKRHWNYPENWIAEWSGPLTISPEYVTKNLVFAAKEGETISGFYALIVDGESADLDHLWIDPIFIGSGLGRMLFDHAVENAKAAGAKMITIESDPNAEGFYRKMGAVRVSETETTVDGNPRTLPNLLFKIGS